MYIGLCVIVYVRLLLHDNGGFDHSCGLMQINDTLVCINHFPTLETQQLLLLVIDLNINSALLLLCSKLAMPILMFATLGRTIIIVVFAVCS